MRKEIYAALQIAENEIRFIVSEFHNGRLYILKLENVAHTGIDNQEITDQASIVAAIKKALANIEKNVGIKIARVILLIPSIQLQRMQRTLHSDINDPLGRILKDNIQDLYRQAYNLKPLENYELINANIFRYKVNGFYVTKTPINEKAGRLYAEFDLYYVQRQVVYQLAGIVEQCGLEILDVCVDGLAVGKEANLFDLNSTEYIVSLLVEDHTTMMSLFYGGKLVHTDSLNIQIDQWIRKVANKLDITFELANKIVFSNVDLAAESYDTNPVCIWKHHSKTYSCSQKDVMDLLQDEIRQYFEEIKVACEQIIQSGPTRFVLVGKNAMLVGFDKGLEKYLQAPVTTYVPSTIGARDSKYVALLGAFFHHIDTRVWQSHQKESIDQVVQPVKSSEDTFSKIKSILKG